jgi:ubiquinone biosynthesis protein COQ9
VKQLCHIPRVRGATIIEQKHSIVNLRHNLSARSDRLRSWQCFSASADPSIFNLRNHMAPTRLANSLLGTFRAASTRPAAGWRQRCAYHSYDYAQPPPFPPAESAILSSAYAHVPSHGFTIDALKLGARDAGYLDVSTNLLPRGVFDLINYHLVTQRLALQNNVQFPEESEGGKKMGVGAKVRTLTLARLRANEPIIHRWQEVGR